MAVVAVLSLQVVRVSLARAVVVVYVRTYIRSDMAVVAVWSWRVVVARFGQGQRSWCSDIAVVAVWSWLVAHASLARAVVMM